MIPSVLDMGEAGVKIEHGDKRLDMVLVAALEDELWVRILLLHPGPDGGDRLRSSKATGGGPPGLPPILDR